MDENAGNNLSNTVLQGTLWTYVARFGGKPFTLLSTIVLVRLLTEEDFGVAAYAVVATSFLAPLASLGIGAALIYYREEDDTSSTAFWLGLTIGTLLFGLTWFFAPLLADIFNDPRAVSVSRVLALTFPLSALGDVQESLLEKRLTFQSLVVPNLAKSAGKGVFSILLAALGLGVWSLIWGQLAGEVLWSLAYWLIFPWRPRLRFLWSRAVAILSYGKDIVATSLLATFLLTADAFFIGRYLGATNLGLYQIALRLPDLIIIQFSHILSKVQFPVYVKASEDPDRLPQLFLQMLRQMSLVIVPLGFGIALIAKPFVLAFFSQDWLDAVPAMQILSLNAIFMFLHHLSSSLFKAKGKLPMLLKLNILRAVVLLPALWWSAAWVGSITAVAITVMAINVLFTILKFLIIGNLFQIPARQLFSALIPALECGALMFAVTLIVINQKVDWSPVLLLVASIALGAAIYIGSSLWLQRDTVFDIRRALRVMMPPR